MGKRCEEASARLRQREKRKFSKPIVDFHSIDFNRLPKILINRTIFIDSRRAHELIIMESSSNENLWIEELDIAPQEAMASLVIGKSSSVSSPQRSVCTLSQLNDGQRIDKLQITFRKFTSAARLHWRLLDSSHWKVFTENISNFQSKPFGFKALLRLLRI